MVCVALDLAASVVPPRSRSRPSAPPPSRNGFMSMSSSSSWPRRANSSCLATATSRCVATESSKEGGGVVRSDRVKIMDKVRASERQSGPTVKWDGLTDHSSQQKKQEEPVSRGVTKAVTTD